MKKPVGIMLAAALLAWFTAMWVHSAQAKPALSHTAAGWMLASLHYDAKGGILLIVGSPTDGPLVFKNEKECATARDSQEGKDMLKMTTAQLSERFHRALRNLALCLPIDAPGETID